MQKLIEKANEINAKKAAEKAQADEKKKARRYEATKDLITVIFGDDAHEILDHAVRFDSEYQNGTFLMSGGLVFRADSNSCSTDAVIGIASAKEDFSDYVSWQYANNLEQFASAVKHANERNAEFEQRAERAKQKAIEAEIFKKHQFSDVHGMISILNAKISNGSKLDSDEMVIAAFARFVMYQRQWEGENQDDYEDSDSDEG